MTVMLSNTLQLARELIVLVVAVFVVVPVDINILDDVFVPVPELVIVFVELAVAVLLLLSVDVVVHEAEGAVETEGDVQSTLLVMIPLKAIRLESTRVLPQ